jgi:hypothetical protein
MSQYYIIHHGSASVAYDLLGITRKVRNGTLSKDDIVLNAYTDEQLPAYQHAELYDVFIEQDAHELSDNNEEYNDHSRGFLALLGNSLGILKDSQLPIVIGGVFFLAASALIAAALIKLPLTAGALIAPIAVYFMFSVLYICMLRLFRVQLLSFRYVFMIIKKHGVALLLASLIPALIGFAVPWLSSSILGVGSVILGAFLSVSVMTYCVFLPLIIVERNVSIVEALSLNHRIFMNLGVERWTIIMGLLVLLILSFPLIITALFMIPITLLALCDIHDRNVVNY